MEPNGVDLKVQIITDVHVQGSYRHRRELWIVMEYCGGGSVSDLLSATGQPVPEDVIAHVCGEALKVGSPHLVYHATAY
jgi:serine/threonine protein kinase